MTLEHLYFLQHSPGTVSVTSLVPDGQGSGPAQCTEVGYLKKIHTFHDQSREIQCILQIKDTLGQPILSFVRRLTSLGGSNSIKAIDIVEIVWDQQMCPL